jgi:apolipoprotein D and lipocalin family protein
MRAVILSVGLALVAACAPPAATGLRDAAAPIYSATGLDPARLAGAWVQSGDIREDPADCGGGQVLFSPAGAGLAVTGTLCLAGRAVALDGTLTPTGPGRLQPEKGAEWWVLWADADRRTLAIGTPDGSFGIVLDRAGEASADRFAAAREILDFNGYDTGRLTRL